MWLSEAGCVVSGLSRFADDKGAGDLPLVTPVTVVVTSSSRRSV